MFSNNVQATIDELIIAVVKAAWQRLKVHAMMRNIGRPWFVFNEYGTNQTMLGQLDRGQGVSVKLIK